MGDRASLMPGLFTLNSVIPNGCEESITTEVPDFSHSVEMTLRNTINIREML